MDRERNTWNSASERFAEHRRLTSLVAATYKACREAPVVAAYNLDPTPGSGSPKWSPATAEYIADVELGVRRALELRPQTDRDELRGAWERLVEDDTRIDATQRRVIGILAPAFYRRKLHPGVYFKPRHLTSKDRGAAITPNQGRI
jgi:hypothetical protein